MKIRTAWVETEIGYELVAASSDDDYYFEEAVDNAAINYGEEPQILCLDVDDDLVAGLFPDHPRP